MKGFYINLYTSIKQFKNLFDSRLTDARARKLDKIDSTITSRATQASVDNVRDKVQNCESVNANILANTEKRVPSSAVAGYFSGAVYEGQQGVKITVSGNGVLRLVRSTLASQPDPGYKKKYDIMVDGKWLMTGKVPVGFDDNVVAGGIRFKNHFKIYVYAIPHVKHSVFYSYTLGD